MPTLESLLRDRLADSRAMNAALNINSERVYLDFGQIAALPKIRLKIKDNGVSVVSPRVSGEVQAAQSDDGAPQSFEAVEKDGKLYAGPDGPEIPIPAGFVLVSEEDLDAVMASAGGDPASGADDASGETDTPQAIDPDDHDKEALITIAENTPGIEFKKSDTKADIAAAINKARGAA